MSVRPTLPPLRFVFPTLAFVCISWPHVVQSWFTGARDCRSFRRSAAMSDQIQPAEARVPLVVVSSPTNAMYKERHIDGFKEDLKSVEIDVNDIYAAVVDIKEQVIMMYTSSSDQRERLIRSIGFSMWCVNHSIIRVIRILREIENYIAMGLADADDLDEDDPLLRARKVEHLSVAMRMASVIVAYGQTIEQHSNRPNGPHALTDLSRNYDKLTFIVVHYRRFGGSGYGHGDGDMESVDEVHRPQLLDAQAAVAVADVDCHRLIVNECLTEMADLTSGRIFIYRRNGLLKKWKSRATSVGRYMMRLMR